MTMMPGASEAREKPQQPVPLPTGTVTFLFTDIEGSAQRWEQHRDAMSAAAARHEHLLTAAMRQHGGYVFKSVGDAFCVAFARANDAIAAALDAQRELSTADFSDVNGLRIRMALHSGVADERENDYFGPTVNRVARLMSIGHGGQVLISSAVQRLVGANLPGGASLIDLGLRRLKDLSQPEHVWQLDAQGLPSDFPPLNSLEERPNNLPLQLTPLIGREHDLVDAKALLDKHRLVTITGSGGVGKTRVALQLGADLIDHFRDGVWFADLAPITDPELVPSVVASAMGMRQAGGRALDESISEWLRSKQLLLIIDNCEHLLDSTAQLVDSIHRNAPSVCVIATSRQPLGITGEVAHRLPSLAVPEMSAGLRAEEAMRYGAIAVFVDRATVVGTSFVLTDDNSPIVADICRHLDGIPLAIELAAARVKVLSISNLAQRLSERFKILTTASRSAVPRQKTLAALIDWSYNLLAPEEQALFRRIGIFAGGFSLDAITAMCCGEGVDEFEGLDLLSSLADKSLVVADVTATKARYRLLESTRAYALEKLASAGERDRLARRQAEYFRDLAQAAGTSFGKGSTLAWLARVELELDNYRSALEWTLTQGHDAVMGAEITGGLGQFWFRGGLSFEGRYWIECAQSQLDVTEHPQLAARLLLSLSWLHSGKKTYETAQQAVKLYESAGDTPGAARTRHSIAQGLFQMGQLQEANEENLRALAALQACGDAWGSAASLDLQGAIAYNLGDIERGRTFKQQALDAFKTIGDELASSIVADNIAELEFADGNAQEAWRLVSQAIEAGSRQRADVVTMGIRYANSIAYRVALGDLEGATISAREALHLARRSQFYLTSAWALQHFALVLTLRGDVRKAARLLGYVNARLKEQGREREATEKWSYDKLIAALEQHLSADETGSLAAEGAAWSEDQAVEEALKSILRGEVQGAPV